MPNRSDRKNHARVHGGLGQGHTYDQDSMAAGLCSHLGARTLTEPHILGLRSNKARRGRDQQRVHGTGFVPKPLGSSGQPLAQRLDGLPCNSPIALSLHRCW